MRGGQQLLGEPPWFAQWLLVACVAGILHLKATTWNIARRVGSMLVLALRMGMRYTRGCVSLVGHCVLAGAST